MRFAQPGVEIQANQIDKNDPVCILRMDTATFTITELP